MTAGRPALVSFDVGDTLAVIDGISHVARIRAASPLPAEQVQRVLREELRLKVLPSPEALTDELADRVCGLLRIDRTELLFGHEPLAPYRLIPGAVDAVDMLAAHLPVVAITNTSVFADGCLGEVRAGLAPNLTEVHTSWRMGVAKPDPQAFRTAAAEHGVATADLLHIGNSWSEDVAPVLALGGRAVWLNPDRATIPGSAPVPPGMLLVANTLAEAVTEAARRWLTR